MQQKNQSLAIVKSIVVPNFFHVVDKIEVFCGTEQVDWPHTEDDEYCRQCGLKIEESNRYLASKLRLYYPDITIEDTAIINDALALDPTLSDKALIRATGLEHIRIIPRQLYRESIDSLSSECGVG